MLSFGSAADSFKSLIFETAAEVLQQLKCALSR